MNNFHIQFASHVVSTSQTNRRRREGGRKDGGGKLPSWGECEGVLLPFFIFFIFYTCDALNISRPYVLRGMCQRVAGTREDMPAMQVLPPSPMPICCGAEAVVASSCPPSLRTQCLSVDLFLLSTCFLYREEVISDDKSAFCEYLDGRTSMFPQIF